MGARFRPAARRRNPRDSRWRRTDMEPAPLVSRFFSRAGAGREGRRRPRGQGQRRSPMRRASSTRSSRVVANQNERQIVYASRRSCRVAPRRIEQTRRIYNVPYARVGRCCCCCFVLKTRGLGVASAGSGGAWICPPDWRGGVTARRRTDRRIYRRPVGTRP